MFFLHLQNFFITIFSSYPKPSQIAVQNFQILIKSLQPSKAKNPSSDSVTLSHHFRLKFLAKNFSKNLFRELNFLNTAVRFEPQPANLHDGSEDSGEHSEAERNGRWTKEQDRQMFKTLSLLCSQAGIDVNSLLIRDTRISSEKKAVLNQVKDAHSWKGTIYVLKNRIAKLLKQDKFSARDVRLLKRLIREELAGKISFQQISEYFPGKTADHIIQFREEYVKTIHIYSINK